MYWHFRNVADDVDFHCGPDHRVLSGEFEIEPNVKLECVPSQVLLLWIG